jgi:hypothetical protein
MELIKARTESALLKMLRILNTRMDLTIDDQKYYLNLKKGYEGEVQFDLLTEKLQSNCLILNDLLLNANNTNFQIDSLIIFQDTIYLFDVKNSEGDYCYESDNFYTISGWEIKNPLVQLKRCTSLFRQLLQNHGFNFPVEPYLIFINPEFTLFKASPDMPIIFTTQLNRFMKKLNLKPSNINNNHKKLAEKLVSLHRNESPYTELPAYEYHQLKMGLTCKNCHSFSIRVCGKQVVCSDCRCQEMVEFAVMRCVEESKLLFPNQKITTNGIHKWCGGIVSKDKIRRLLGRNFIIIGAGQWAFYE